MGYFVIANSVARIPGMFGIIGAMFDSLQRFDIKIKLNAILGTVVNVPLTYLIVYCTRYYFSMQPQYGEAFGALIGVSLAGIVCGIVDFIIFGMMYRKMGFFIGNLFRVDFDKENLKEAFGFGGKLTIGNSFRAFAGVIETILISLYVMNFGSELGYYNMTSYTTTMLAVINEFLNALKPAISEAFGNRKMKLTEYYFVEGLKWMNYMLCFILGLMFVIGDNVIMLAGSQWAGALKFIAWHLIFAAFWPMAWFADTVFQGTGRAEYNTIVWIIEQGTRIILLFMLLPLLQIWGIIFSYIPGIMAKNISSLWIIQSKIQRFNFRFKQTFLIPAISALGMYFILSGVDRFFQTLDLFQNVLFIVILFFIGFNLYGFFTGLFGGYSKETLLEFKKGLQMVPVTKRLFLGLFKATELGFKLMPSKASTQNKLYILAQIEAQQLQQMQKEKD